MTFETLGLIEPILKALTNEGYVTPTPIQSKAIPIVLEGSDMIGCAQTGTGKTAAFALPIIQNLYNKHNSGEKTNHNSRRPIQVLILTPTRELAIQIDESFGAYGKFANLKHTVIFGGVGQHPQTVALKKGVDILTATPGRLLDLMNQGFVDLNKLEVFVLDEADRMLDMGFIHDVKKVIAKLPVKRQTVLFSATMPPEIVKLSSSILIHPKRVEVTPQATTAQTINQSLYFVERGEKKDLLNHLLSDDTIERALVFTRTKHGANKVVKELLKVNIRAEAIHGNKSQTARQLALKNFKSKTTRVLVATDIAARGIDVDDLTHVINYEIPNIPETYVHRIGRTGRAGASGIAISFCESEERAYLKDIQKLIGLQIPVVKDGKFSSSIPAEKEFPRPVENFGKKQPSQHGRQPRPQGSGQNSRPKPQNRNGNTSANKPEGQRDGQREKPQNRSNNPNSGNRRDGNREKPQTRNNNESGNRQEGNRPPQSQGNKPASKKPHRKSPPKTDHNKPTSEGSRDKASKEVGAAVNFSVNPPKKKNWLSWAKEKFS